MKNLSLILNLVLLVAVAVLFYLHFSANTPAQANETADMSVAGSKENLRVAYINSDSLLKHYDYMEELTAELEETQQKFENEFKNRKQGLEREIQNFQQNMNNMTRAQAMAVQEDLVQKQQNLVRYQENLTQQLMQEEASKQNELYDRVAAYLKEYGSANQLELVLTYTKGSGVLYASDSLDITSAVIDGLNSQYSSGSAVEADSTQAE
ncbi:OmpH family outer membrane protein [Roseivirga sp. BDSF3-8]|uniref:OmpH family outer membrane protein n=1 Tax=Roseivirga sp. BDSF3-8 TaxID=3241598 RepID=UPI00353212AA